MSAAEDNSLPQVESWPLAGLAIAGGEETDGGEATTGSGAVGWVDNGVAGPRSIPPFRATRLNAVAPGRGLPPRRPRGRPRALPPRGGGGGMATQRGHRAREAGASRAHAMH